jgi:hypothetical protein
MCEQGASPSRHSELVARRELCDAGAYQYWDLIRSPHGTVSVCATVPPEC